MVQSVVSITEGLRSVAAVFVILVICLRYFYDEAQPRSDMNAFMRVETHHHCTLSGFLIYRLFISGVKFDSQEG